MRETTMMDSLMIYSCAATMRHAGYLSFAAAVLGLAEAHYPGLRHAVLRAAEWLRSGRRAAMRRAIAMPRHGKAPFAQWLSRRNRTAAKFSTRCRIRA
jgi:hypothetical protein